jgi:hypothetical protein
MEKPNIKLLDTDTEIGMGLAGAIDVSYAKLVKVLGEPNFTEHTDQYKVDAAWILELNGKPITVYNYKDGKNYNGDNGLPTSKITDWHIGYAGEDEEIAPDIEQLKAYLDSIPLYTKRMYLTVAVDIESVNEIDEDAAQQVIQNANYEFSHEGDAIITNTEIMEVSEEIDGL